MHIKFTQTYKSLGAFDFEDVPRFTVLTGPNGSGKTQLLELIERAVKNNDPPNLILGRQFSPDDVLRLSSEWGNLSDPKTVGFATIQKQHQVFWGQFQEYVRQPRRELHLKPLFEELCKSVGKEAKTITQDEFVQSFDLSAPAAQNQVFNQSEMHSLTFEFAN